MDLGLQMKKFINSEHVGEYTEIAFPVENVRRKSTEEGGDVSYETIKLHYMDEGSGEPIILLHSYGQSLYTWRNVFRRLAENYRVIALDLVGHGHSDRPSDFDYTITAHADSIKLFMDSIGIQSAHIVGYSLASYIAMDLVQRYPDRTGCLILMSPATVTPEMPLAIRMLDSSFFGGIASRLYGMRTVRKLLEECYFDLTNLTDEVVEAYYSTASDSEGRRAIQLSMSQRDEYPIVSKLRTIENSALILYGVEDKWHSLEDIELVHVAMPNSKLQQVRNAGHLFNEEKPEKIVEYIKEMIPVEE